MTASCMELVDSDKDGMLTKTELKVTPGLLSAAGDLDENSDGKLSRDEIFTRFELYIQSKVGLQGFSCKIQRANGDPIEDAQIKLVPEPFMADYIETAEGEVIDENTGFAELTSDPEVPGTVRVGMYRVEITSPTIKIPSKYNEKTTLGVEVAPVTNSTSNRELIWVIR